MNPGGSAHAAKHSTHNTGRAEHQPSGLHMTAWGGRHHACCACTHALLPWPLEASLQHTPHSAAQHSTQHTHTHSTQHTLRAPGPSLPSEPLLSQYTLNTVY
jgi:hypothetical protein